MYAVIVELKNLADDTEVCEIARKYKTLQEAQQGLKSLKETALENAEEIEVNDNVEAKFSIATIN